MNAIILAAVFIGGMALTTLLFVCLLRAYNAPRRERKRPNEKIKTETNIEISEELKIKRKIEFTKLTLWLVLLVYFVTVGVGIYISLIDFTQFSTLAMLVGSPTAIGLGFTTWKSKAENMIKLKRDNPEETAGVPVDLNNINA